MPQVSIVETRNIIRAIRNTYHYDFSHYALTQLRYRIDEVFTRHNLLSPGTLTNKLNEDEKFFDEFLYEISVPQTEIYRDPEMWILLREEILPRLMMAGKSLNIWFPDSTDGNDLVSLYYILEQAGRRARFFASCLSEKMISELQAGKQFYPVHLPEITWENFSKVHPGQTRNFFEELSDAGSVYRKGIFRKVIFFRQDLNFDPAPGETGMILFRNKLLNLTPEFQNQILEKLTQALLPGGFLIIGFKEKIDDFLEKHDTLEVFHPGENVYRKKQTV